VERRAPQALRKLHEAVLVGWGQIAARAGQRHEQLVILDWRHDAAASAVRRRLLHVQDLPVLTVAQRLLEDSARISLGRVDDELTRHRKAGRLEPCGGLRSSATRVDDELCRELLLVTHGRAVTRAHDDAVESIVTSR